MGGGAVVLVLDAFWVSSGSGGGRRMKPKEGCGICGEVEEKKRASDDRLVVGCCRHLVWVRSLLEHSDCWYSFGCLHVVEEVEV